jgi:hypothetical protein
MELDDGDHALFYGLIENPYLLLTLATLFWSPAFALVAEVPV